MDNKNIRWLTTVPASDGNFKSHLKSATMEELKEAASIMAEKGVKGNIARSNAIASEIRKRDRQKPDNIIDAAMKELLS